jgi:hypothetical protein
VTPSALPKTLDSFLSADAWLQRFSRQMLVIQPTIITARSAEGDVVPEGATAFYTCTLPAGEF